jgi:hypothetical protein
MLCLIIVVIMMGFPTAFTLMRTWPRPGSGVGTSLTTSFSGGPCSTHSTAFM